MGDFNEYTPNRHDWAFAADAYHYFEHVTGFYFDQFIDLYDNTRLIEEIANTAAYLRNEAARDVTKEGMGSSRHATAGIYVEIRPCDSGLWVSYGITATSTYMEVDE